MKLKDILRLRREIVLNSLFTSDYQNTLGYDERKVHDFFDGYCEYLSELMKEAGIADNDYFDKLETFDNDDNLTNYIYLFEEINLK